MVYHQNEQDKTYILFLLLTQNFIQHNLFDMPSQMGGLNSDDKILNRLFSDRFSKFLTIIDFWPQSTFNFFIGTVGAANVTRQ